MKISFLNINRPQKNPRRYYLPTGLINLATIAKQKGHSATIIDYEDYFESVECNDTESLVRNIAHNGYDLLCVNVNALNIAKAISLSRSIKCKNRDIFMFWGGPQSTACSGEILKRYEFIDCIALGEGEKIFENFLTTYRGNMESLSQIKGLAFMSEKSKRIVTTEKQPLINDPDSLPYPDWTLVPENKFPLIDHIIIETGRGCVYNCAFCSTCLMWERRLRLKSPRRILKEIRHAREFFGTNTFQMLHDNFLLNRGTVCELCDLIRKHEPNIYWSCSTSADLVTEDVLKDLARAGCKTIFIGIESGSPVTLKKIHKQINLEMIPQIIKKAIHHGIRIQQSFIAGFPFETSGQINRTIDLALNNVFLGAHTTNLAAPIPLAGTEIYNDYRENLQFLDIHKDMKDFTPTESAEIRSSSALFSYNYSCGHSGNMDPIFFSFICYLLENYLLRLPYSFHTSLKYLDSEDYLGFASNLLKENSYMSSEKKLDTGKFATIFANFMSSAIPNPEYRDKMVRLIHFENELYNSRKLILISTINLCPHEDLKASLTKKYLFYISTAEIGSRLFYKSNFWGVLKFLLERKQPAGAIITSIINFLLELFRLKLKDVFFDDF